MQLLIALLTAVFAGAVIPMQAGANAMLARALGHPLWAALVSLALSAVLLVPVLLALRVPLPQLAALAGQPRWIWLGGAAGAIYVTAAVIMAPRLGAAGFMLALIAGQILAAMLIDQLGAVGFQRRPLDTPRLIGAGLVLAGVLVMQGPALWRMLRGG
ncbi:DMT family transporter [Paracoccus spongiarum]|uniref:DMT family transporter n=1 Tax=Paracoccus spongiarum TaxID=3064387 RepID=A0ABT9JGR2_9RHOB|nr:DMT family transporter [Paracoccus sp. 2205BS29-5]MDP5309021.1 DMT family transporter [Paracoccus sp. 2205BS29-5]